MNLLLGPLGHLVIEFAYLELELGKLVSRIVHADDVFGLTLASLSFSSKLGIIRELVEQRRLYEEAGERLVGLLKEARKVNEERNKFVHGEFLSVVDDQDQHVGALHRAVRNANKPFDDVEPQALEAMAPRVSELTYEVRKFSATMFDRAPDPCA